MYVVKERRPSGEDNHSFPSGHATTAFQGAELVRMEYGGWYGVAAYVMATGVAVERVVYDKHWIHDVVMGAGIGILSARVSLWLLPWEKRLFRLDGKQKKAMAIVPYYDAGNHALGSSLYLYELEVFNIICHGKKHSLVGRLLAAFDATLSQETRGRETCLFPPIDRP